MRLNELLSILQFKSHGHTEMSDMMISDLFCVPDLQPYAAVVGLMTNNILLSKMSDLFSRRFAYLTFNPTPYTFNLIL